VAGPVIIEKAKCCYNEMKITGRSTFFECSNKKITCKNLGHCRYCLIIWPLSGSMGAGLEEFYYIALTCGTEM
jgi:hypothetical protein